MNIKTIELSGVIGIDWGDWYQIKLIQDDGYKIDLVSRFKEAAESFPNCKVQVNYYLSDAPCTKDEMVEAFLKTLYGHPEAGYTQSSYRYSSWTSGTDYDTNLSIGGHDLARELYNEADKFIILELNFQIE